MSEDVIVENLRSKKLRSLRFNASIYGGLATMSFFGCFFTSYFVLTPLINASSVVPASTFWALGVQALATGYFVLQLIWFTLEYFAVLHEDD